MFLEVQPVHLHQHTRATRARKSANTVSANTVSILPKVPVFVNGGYVRYYIILDYDILYYNII